MSQTIQRLRRWWWGLGLAWCTLLSPGCGSSDVPQPSAEKRSSTIAATPAANSGRSQANDTKENRRQQPGSFTDRSAQSDSDSKRDPTSGATHPAKRNQLPADLSSVSGKEGLEPDTGMGRERRTSSSPASGDRSRDRQPSRRTLGELLEGRDVDQLFPGSAAGQFGDFSLPLIEEARIISFGLRRFAGQHLVLYTDLADEATGNELVAVFDLAVPQWCSYFGVDPVKARDWKMVGYLMQDREQFQAAGLLPTDLPPFLHGYQRRAELWMNEQPTDYYRRHLLLHEGTHGFMEWSLGACGPPWYMEGVAELLATHRWDSKQLTLNSFPASKEETPYWGRIKVIKDERAAHRALPLEQILQFDPQAHLKLEPYAWSWAAAAFLDRHPAYREAFRGLQRQVRAPGQALSAYFYETQADHWAHLSRQWQYFVMRLDYGFDVEREAITQRPVKELAASGAKVTIEAQQGWQSTGLRLTKETTYRVVAEGQFTLAQTPKPWVSEANGITLRYYGGKPLGLLLGAIVDETQPATTLTTLVTPEPLGREKTWKPASDGTLYLRMNDSPAELADNTGQLNVTIQPVP